MATQDEQPPGRRGARALLVAAFTALVAAGGAVPVVAGIGGGSPAGAGATNAAMRRRDTPTPSFTPLDRPERSVPVQNQQAPARCIIDQNMQMLSGNIVAGAFESARVVFTGGSDSADIVKAASQISISSFVCAGTAAEARAHGIDRPLRGLPESALVFWGGVSMQDLAEVAKDAGADGPLEIEDLPLNLDTKGFSMKLGKATVPVERSVGVAGFTFAGRIPVEMMADGVEEQALTAAFLTTGTAPRDGVAPKNPWDTSAERDTGLIRVDLRGPYFMTMPFGEQRELLMMNNGTGRRIAMIDQHPGPGFTPPPLSPSPTTVHARFDSGSGALFR